jgi:hypothetical protein
MRAFAQAAGEVPDSEWPATVRVPGESAYPSS